VYLNFRYFVAVFYRLDHPFKRRLETLRELNLGSCIQRTGEGGCDYKISSPAGIFTAELIALFVLLRHIGDVIQPPEKCLILTDSLSSVKALLSIEKYHIGLIRWFTNVSRCVTTYWKMELRLKNVDLVSRRA
jgi:hypothetical protein